MLLSPLPPLRGERKKKAVGDPFRRTSTAWNLLFSDCFSPSNRISSLSHDTHTIVSIDITISDLRGKTPLKIEGLSGDFPFGTPSDREIPKGNLLFSELFFLLFSNIVTFSRHSHNRVDQHNDIREEVKTTPKEKGCRGSLPEDFHCVEPFIFQTAFPLPLEYRHFLTTLTQSCRST